MSKFCSLETVIKKVITLEGQFPNCFYGLCSLIFQSVCLNTGLCHGNFPIGFNIVALVPLLPDCVFYPVPDFLPRSTESSDPLLMFVIHRYFQDVQFRKSGSLQMNFFSLLVSDFLRWNHRRNDGSLFGKWFHIMTIKICIIGIQPIEILNTIGMNIESHFTFIVESDLFSIKLVNTKPCKSLHLFFIYSIKG